MTTPDQPSHATSRTLVISDVAFRPDTRARDFALIMTTSLALALAAQIRFHIPFTPVPVTAQTFVVGLAGLLLGARRAGYGVLLYLIEGAAGLPFFAGGAGGFSALTGATAGYLFAMPLGAWVTGFLAERGWDRSLAGTFAAIQAGSLLILASGTLWLSVITGSLAGAAALGFFPFLLGDLVKASVAAVLFSSLWTLRERFAG